jgi:hypothetical protein
VRSEKTEELELLVKSKNEKVFEINTISKRFSYFSMVLNVINVIVTVTLKFRIFDSRFKLSHFESRVP